MTAIELIQETVDFYSADPAHRRAVRGPFGRCDYKTADGQMCAVGRCILPEENYSLEGSVGNIYREVGGKTLLFEALLDPKYRGFPIELWEDLQRFHDRSMHWNDYGLSKEGKEYAIKIINKWTP